MYSRVHPFYTVMQEHRIPSRLNPVYTVGLISGRGWFSKATKKVGKVIKNAKKTVQKAAPIVKKMLADPTVKKYLDNSLVKQAGEAIYDKAKDKYSAVVKPYADLYTDGRELLNAANGLKSLPVVGGAVGYALDPFNDVVENIIDPLAEVPMTAGKGLRRGKSKMINTSSIIASAGTRSTRTGGKRTVRRR